MATTESIRNAVFDAASENAELLNTLAKTSEAPSIYHAHLIHLDRLEKSLTEQSATLSSLKTQTDLKFKSHRKLRDSVTKRWFYRATKMLAKFEARAMGEEREYFSALGTQSKAEERCKVLETQVEKAKAEKEKLEKVAKTHDDAHAKIDSLYEKLFKGPTPGFEDEDERENKFYSSKKVNDGIVEEIKKARRAKAALGVVKTYIGRAQGNFKFGVVAAEQSLFFLDQATYWVERGDTAIELAVEAMKRSYEYLLPLPQGSTIDETLVVVIGSAAVLKGQNFSKDAMIDAIQSSLDRLTDAEEKVNELISHAKEVEKAGLVKIRETASQLEESRQELQEIRQGIFERVAGFGQAAPAYNECCNRTDRFCVVPEVEHEHVHEEEEPPAFAPTAVEPTADTPTTDTPTENAPTTNAPMTTDEKGTYIGPGSRFVLADVLRDEMDMRGQHRY